MDGREAIIAEITEKANAAAAGLIEEAERERDELLASVRAEEERKREEALAAAHAAAEALRARRATLDNLQARKIRLAAKQQCIDAAFEEAEKKLGNMTDHIYREFVASFIAECAEEGDCVVIAESDAKRLHDEWLKDVSKKCGFALAFAKDRHSGKGGVILRGKSCDKNLTLSTLLAALREQYTGEVARRLFK